MKLSKFLSAAAVAFFATTAAFAVDLPKDADLRKMALDNGLKPIPKSQKDIDALIASIAKDVEKNPTTSAKIELGKKLYFDPRLSKSNLISCNTCHNLGLGGVDMVSAATGHKWAANPEHLNSPTVYNSVFNDVQFWNGRAAHLGEQAAGPIENPVEMADSEKNIIAKINSIPEYVKEFKAAFGADAKINLELVASAIAVFERTLVTPSAFDDFLNGNAKALTNEQKKGLATFIDKGCAACHTGVNLGGAMNVFPVVKPYKYAKLGGFKGDAAGMVKVPTLRNVAQTAPYFHNGAIWELSEAIKEMGKTQLGMDLSADEVAEIEAFLASLTGRKPKVEYPMLPMSRNNTPRPDMR